jgi:DNA repair protein RecN (Recombination protein N)
MLSELHIKDFAIIDNLEISFSKGLNVLTGETGTGKSIIINAVNMILGNKASDDLIRTSAKEGIVEALFDIAENEHLSAKLRDRGFEMGKKQGLHEWGLGSPSSVERHRRGIPQYLWSA